MDAAAAATAVPLFYDLMRKGDDGTHLLFLDYDSKREPGDMPELVSQDGEVFLMLSGKPFLLDKFSDHFKTATLVRLIVAELDPADLDPKRIFEAKCIYGV